MGTSGSEPFILIKAAPNPAGREAWTPEKPGGPWYLVTGDALYRGTLYAFYESTDPVALARSIDRLCELERVATFLPGHNELSLTRDDLSRAQAAFHAIERKGALHHGSGLHDFGAISIRL